MIDMVKINPELTPEEKMEIEIGGCLHFWDEYKNKTMIRQYVMPIDKVCRIYFDLLVSKGLIKLSKEDQNRFKAKAEELYMAHLNQSKLSRQISRNMYELMMASVVSDECISVKNIRGKLALLEYFDALLSQNKELNDLIIR